MPELVDEGGMASSPRPQNATQPLIAHFTSRTGVICQ